MASPFDVFRKNQKVLMALLVGLSMVAFIVADSIDATNFPIFLGAALGALALWLLSGKGGSEGWLIAGVGAILGAIVGLYGPDLVGNNTAVYTAQGNLSYQQVTDLAESQRTANEFLRLAGRAVFEKLPEDQRTSYRGPEPFGFVNVADAPTQRENAVMTFLFQKEADGLGIEFTDEAVNRYIRDVTQEKLTSKDFREIRNQLQIGTGELVDVLRGQLRAREAYRLLVPRVGPTPQDLWADFKKLSTEAELSVVAVPAEAFVAEVADPSEGELARFFDQYDDVPPGADGRPGFLVPRQVQVAYLEVPLAAVRKSVTPPTDEEVRAFYDRNRAPFETSRPPGTTPEGTSTAPAGGAAGAETPTNEAPLEAPRPKPPEAADSAPEAGAETPADEPAAPSDSNGAELRTQDGTEFVAFQEKSPPEAAATAPASDPAPPADAASPAALAAPGAATSGSAKPEEPSKETLDAVREDMINQRAREAADAKLEQTIEDMHEIVMRIMDAVPLPEDPNDEEQKRKHEEARRTGVRKVVEEMKSYAAKNGLKFATTPLMSFDELYESEDYPIGSAIRWEKNAPLFGRDTTPLAQTLFLSSPDQPLSPIAAQNAINESRYVALKIADMEPRVPSLEEKAVRENAEQQWKLLKARELARKRAEKLVEKASKGKAELAAEIAGETVTGKAGGQELTAREVGPFTWLRRSSVPAQGFQLPDVVPNELPQVPGAGEAFMQTVFEELDRGETGLAPAADGSAYYVVEVKERSSGEEVAKMREEFLKENPFSFLSPFRMRMFNEAGEVRQKWFEAFRQRHEVVFQEAGPAAES